jgi:hypothetical protein
MLPVQLVLLNNFSIISSHLRQVLLVLVYANKNNSCKIAIFMHYFYIVQKNSFYKNGIWLWLCHLILSYREKECASDSKIIMQITKMVETVLLVQIYYTDYIYMYIYMYIYIGIIYIHMFVMSSRKQIICLLEKYAKVAFKNHNKTRIKNTLSIKTWQTTIHRSSRINYNKEPIFKRRFAYKIKNYQKQNATLFDLVIHVNRLSIHKKPVSAR